MDKMFKTLVESQPAKDTVRQISRLMDLYTRDLCTAIDKGNIGEAGRITEKIVSIAAVLDELDAFMNPTEPSGPNVL